MAWGLAVSSNLLYRNQLLDSMANMASAERPTNIYDDVVLKLKSCNDGIVTLNQHFLKNADSLMKQSGISTALEQLTSGSITSNTFGEVLIKMVCNLCTGSERRTLQTYLEFQFLSTPGIFFANLVVLVVGGLVTDTRERARLLSTLRREGVIAKEDAGSSSEFDVHVARWLQRCVDVESPESSDDDNVKKGEAVEIKVADYPLDDDAVDDNEGALNDEAKDEEQADAEVPHAELFSFARWLTPPTLPGPAPHKGEWRLSYVKAFLQFAKRHGIELPPAPTSNSGRTLGNQKHEVWMRWFKLALYTVSDHLTAEVDDHSISAGSASTAAPSLGLGWVALRPDPTLKKNTVDVVSNDAYVGGITRVLDALNAIDDSMIKTLTLLAERLTAPLEKSGSTYNHLMSALDQSASSDDTPSGSFVVSPLLSGSLMNRLHAVFQNLKLSLDTSRSEMSVEDQKLRDERALTDFSIDAKKGWEANLVHFESKVAVFPHEVSEANRVARLVSKYTDSQHPLSVIVRTVQDTRNLAQCPIETLAELSAAVKATADFSNKNAPLDHTPIVEGITISGGGGDNGGDGKGKKKKQRKRKGKNANGNGLNANGATSQQQQQQQGQASQQPGQQQQPQQPSTKGKKSGGDVNGAQTSCSCGTAGCKGGNHCPIERRVGQFRGLLCALKDSGMNPGYIPPSLFHSLLEVERGLQLSGQHFFNNKERIPGGNSRANGASAHEMSIAELTDVLAQKRKDVGLDVDSLGASLVDAVKNMDGDKRALLAEAIAGS